LKNNFSTADVITELDDLIKAVNKYLTKDKLKHPTLKSILKYVLFIFNVSFKIISLIFSKCFGLVYEEKT